MTSPRRRVIRPPSPVRKAGSTRLPRLRDQLELKQQALTNWTAKLKRAFHSFEKHTRQITLLQRRIRELEES